MKHEPAHDAAPPGRQAGTPRRCLVWLPPGASPPAALLSGLARRGTPMAVVHDPASVMLQLATEPAAACILVQPEKLPRLHELTEAIRIYHPETACWRFSFDADHRPRLDELESNGADAQPARAVQDEPPPPPPPPPGKPADAAQRQPAGDGQASLSAEELDMLLAPMSEGTQKETQPSQRN